ncbi:MAG TPA: copper resistance system multicopper oxidase [Azospirillaceae bacterium]|nr:copper resistance system multicopper oxidase [Azospirillaceae bacterium]
MVGRLGNRLRRGLFALGLIAASSPAWAGEYNLVLDEKTVNITGRSRTAQLINGQLPGPVLRLKEGEDAVIHVTNNLDEPTSIHWHGLILPSEQDGVPHVSTNFHGIQPGQTFTYRIPVRQAGTYWFHSHSATQEQTGVYAPIIIDPAGREPFRYDRDYVVMLSDWTDENPVRIIKNLKSYPGYYNRNRRTLTDVIRDWRSAEPGENRQGVVRDWLAWQQMRMDPTDIADVTGYTFLVNGRTPEQNFTALFKPGERVRLRFINAAAMTYFDVRIPGLKMTVVQADGNNVQPVQVDEFRIAIAETLDVIVQPREDKAYSVLAESMDRTGFARATLATREGMAGEIPPPRPRPTLTMADMGSSFGPTGLDRGTAQPETDAPGHVAPMDMDHGGMSHGAAPTTHQNHGTAPAGRPNPTAGMDHSHMGHGTAPAQQPHTAAGMDHAAMGHGTMDHAAMGHGAMGHGAMDHAAMGHGGAPDPIAHDTGAPPGTRVLSYRDLRALNTPYPPQEPDRIIEIRLTGNMERYFWSINGRKFSEARPIRLRYGERVRFRFINETMMNHPMHLHGMWMIPDVGNGARNPLKHVVNIKPGTTLDVDIPADAEGDWAFHCHLLYHMETGMMRHIVVERRAAALD